MKPATRSIRIRQYTFQVAAPFSAGHQLSEAEAEALNALRAENLRNNLSKKLPQGRLNAEQIAEARQLAAKLDSEYEFRTREQRQQKGQLEREIEAEAADRVYARARSQGEVLSASEVRARIEAEATRPEVIEAATRRIEQAARLAEASLASLVEGG